MSYTKNTILNVIMMLCLALSLKANAQSKVINSGWQFSEDKINWETINIPHNWNTNDAFDDESGYRRGLGYYKKQVFVPSEEKNKIHYLKFNAINQEATIYVNGKLIGNHKGGYTAFNFDISKDINYNQYNLIEVTVDNSHNLDIPPLDADFTFYGGIYRDVELITLEKQHFSLSDFASDGLYVDYYDVSEDKAGVEIKAIFNNSDSKDIKTNLYIKLFNAQDDEVQYVVKSLVLPAHANKETKFKLPQVVNPKLWSPDSPYLYRLQLKLLDANGQVLDIKYANVGFRWVSVDAQNGFYLNGKPIKLIGVNRHQDYEGYGNAVPKELQKQDIHLIKNMGANVIRFAHYPHSRELYDLCDELGILVWTEIPIVNKVTDSDAFFEVCTTMQNEHVKQYFNHPSVVMFGYMNEIFLRMAFNNKLSEQERESEKKSTMKLAHQLEDLTRKLAPNHITVMAGHLNEVYNETGIANVPKLFGWNLYFGWYDKEIADLGVFLDDQHKRYPNRSMLLSEYGPGADVRIFTKTPKKFDFSTDYQARLHQSYYQQINERPYMTGMTAWNFADFGSEFRGDAIPHVNQKGLVQYDRTPKDIYYWYKSVLDKKTAFLHIASSYLTGLILFENESYPISFYSNQNDAIVFLNGKKIKTVNFENGIATLEIPFQNGQNVVKLVSGKISEERIVNVLKLYSLDFKDFKRFGINMGSHFFAVDEEHQFTFVPDQPYKKGWFGYVDGKPFGMTKDKNQGIPHNIKNSNSEPIFQTMLEGCSTYKVDVPDGAYQVTLFFVEPQIKAKENIYNLSGSVSQEQNREQRVFDIYLNEMLVEKQFNLAEVYPEKYGVKVTLLIDISDKKGLTIAMQPINGKTVISGILIEKID